MSDAGNSKTERKPTKKEKEAQSIEETKARMRGGNEKTFKRDMCHAFVSEVETVGSEYCSYCSRCQEMRLSKSGFSISLCIKICQFLGIPFDVIDIDNQSPILKDYGIISVQFPDGTGHSMAYVTKRNKQKFSLTESRAQDMLGEYLSQLRRAAESIVVKP